MVNEPRGNSLLKTSRDSARRSRCRAGLLSGLVALVAVALAPGAAFAQTAKTGAAVAPRQTAKLRLERFAFDALPDLKVYLTYVEPDGTVIAGRAASDFTLNLDSAE